MLHLTPELTGAQNDIFAGPPSYQNPTTPPNPNPVPSNPRPVVKFRAHSGSRPDIDIKKRDEL